MSQVTVNSYPVLKLELIESKQGNWVADLEARIPEEADELESVVLDFGGATFRGHVFRGGIQEGRWRGRIVGGRGGLLDPLEAKYYGSTSASQVLNDVASDTGETLSETITSDVKSFALAKWLRPEGNGKTALGDLAESLGVTWRVLRDGSIWLGSDRYEAVDPEEFKHRTISPDALTGSVVSAPAYPGVRPGVLFLDQKVSNTVTTLTRGKLRQVVYFEDEDRSVGRLGAVFRRIVENVVGRRIDYSQCYPATVVRQSGDLLDVIPDDPRIKGDGLTKLSIAHGLPGTRVEVAKGARVRVFFEAGLPSKPKVALFDTNPSDVSLIQIGGEAADFVGLSTLINDNFSNLKTWDDAHTHPTGVGPSGPPATPSPTPADVASETLRTT